MQAGPNPLGGGGSSFTARKPAASSLPTFELPPPQINNLHESKYQPFISPNSGLPVAGSGSVASVGNLLTPPNTVPGDGLSPTTVASLAAFTHATQNSHAFSQNGFWPATQQTQQLAPSPSQQYSQSTQRQWIPPSGMYSPSSMNSIARGSDYGLPARSLPPSTSNSEFFQLPPFNATMSAPVNLPAMYPPQLPMSSGMMHQQVTGNSQMQNSQAQDQYGVRLPPTPTYSNQATSTSSPQPNTFSPSSATSSNPMRPHTSNSQKQMHSAPGSLDLGQPLPHQQSPPQYQRPFGQFPLPNTNGGPQVNGPVMTNMHTPNANMALVGGSMPANFMPPYASGHAATMQAMYAAHGAHPGQGPLSDRPFKCDQCMQSFNRNHDLKRHKRIHLAVKPYPCGHCDKSFSRKDALKV